MQEQKQDLNFYLVAATAAIADAVSIGQSRIRMRIAIALAILSLEAGIILFPVVFHSYAFETAIFGIGVAVIGFLWSLCEMPSLWRKKREGQIALTLRVEELAKLSGAIVEPAGSGDMNDKLDDLDRVDNKFRWRVIQSYLRMLEHLALDK